MLRFCFLLLCVIVSDLVADPVDHSDCGSDYTIKEVEIEGCSTLPCILETGSSYGITLTIKPTYPSNSLTQEVFLMLYEVQLKVDVTPENPCASFVCPVQISNGAKYSGQIYLAKNLVPAKGELWWKMTTDTGKLAVCMKTSIRTVRPKYMDDIIKSSYLHKPSV